MGKGRFSLTWPFTKEGLQDMLTSIERQKSIFAVALANDSIRLSAAITVLVEEIDIVRHAHESQFQAFESSRLEIVDQIWSQ